MKPVVFAGNDYLGLARDPRLADAMCVAARKYGVSATSGRFFLGWTDVHRGLEQDLANFFQADCACLLTSTYLAGLVYFGTLAETHRVVFCDEFSHSNLVKGMASAGFEIRMFKHMDAEDLERQLDGYDGPPPVIATDSIFGISGELAPIRALIGQAERTGAELLIDDAHGVFCAGDNGRGISDMFGIDFARVTVIGSMSKALGGGGGFFLGRRSLVERLQRATAGASPLSVPLAAACAEALRIVGSEPGLRSIMWQNSARMREILAAKGVGVVCDRTPIVAMMLKSEDEAVRLAEHFESVGIIIRHARYPSEPRYNLLRSAARACHTEEDMLRLEKALASFFD